MKSAPHGYSTAQVTLHWLVVALILFQFLASDAIEEAWRAFSRGTPLPETPGLAYAHIASGILILLFALTRLFLRFTRGVPGLPADQPAALRGVAHGTHWLIYLLIILLPLSGAGAWFGGSPQAAGAHVLMKNVLFFAVLLHVAGALVEHFVLRSQVLMRMLRPQNG